MAMGARVSKASEAIQRAIAEDICPKCKRESVNSGFGLMGGGYGPYWFCVIDDCEWFYKKQLCTECDSMCDDGDYQCPDHLVTKAKPPTGKRGRE